MIEKGTFISYWSDGSTVSCGAELDTETGEIIDLQHMDAGVEDRGHLVKEVFENEDGDEIEVCNCCHSHVLKGVMVDGVGHCMDEDFICSDPDCPSNENDYDMDEFQNNDEEEEEEEEEE